MKTLIKGFKEVNSITLPSGDAGDSNALQIELYLKRVCNAFAMRSRRVCNAFATRLQCVRNALHNFCNAFATRCKKETMTKM